MKTDAMFIVCRAQMVVAPVSDIVRSSWILITTLKQIKSHDSHLEGVIQTETSRYDKYLKYTS